MATKKAATKKAATKKAATKNAATKKAATKKAATKKAATKKAATKKAATKKAATKKKAVTKKAATTKESTSTKKPATPGAAPAAAGSTSGALHIGSPAPAFSLPGDDGKTHALAAHKGHPVVLYFYPRDNTPGCTTEACDFRDNMARLTSKGAVVFGVSRDSLASHAKFRAKFDLNFTLLSDEDRVAHDAYGAWGEKLMYGKPVTGTIRSTFLIDGAGRLAAMWPKVKVAGHVDDVIEALGRL